MICYQLVILKKVKENQMTDTNENIEQVEVDSLTEEDETLIASAVELIVEQQAEHDASFDEEETRNVQEDETTQIAVELEADEDDYSDINFDKALSSEERGRLKESTFCGPERSYPVPDKSHAVAALSRAKQFASDELYKKIKSCVCRKATANGWDLPSCSEDSWSEELKQEALDKEALIMGWITEEESELKKSHDAAMARIAELESSLDKVLTKFAETTDGKILEKDDIKLADKIEWFGTISNTENAKEDSVVQDMNIVIDNPSIASTDEVSTPSENTSLKSLGSFERKIVDNYNKILNSDGEAAAEAYYYSKQQYLRRGFHPKNY
jgi:hypothetical protein